MAWELPKTVAQGLNKAKEFANKVQTASGGSGANIPPKKPIASATPNFHKGPSLLGPLARMPPEPQAIQATSDAAKQAKNAGLWQKTKAVGKFAKDVGKASWKFAGGSPGLSQAVIGAEAVLRGLNSFNTANKRIQGDNSKPSALYGLSDMIYGAADTAGQALGAIIPNHPNFGKTPEATQFKKGYDEFGRAAFETINDVASDLSLGLIPNMREQEAEKAAMLAVENQRIADYKAGKLTAEQTLVNQSKNQQPKTQNRFNPMPLPQINTLTAEQVAQVTNGSDEPSKWRVGGDGSGVIKRSDGTYAHVRALTQDEQAARDKQYEEYINDQAKQYMLDYMSKANSSLYSPQERAIYANLALGLHSAMANRNSAANAAKTAAQNTAEQKALADSLKRQEEQIENDETYKDDPQGKNIALKNLQKDKAIFKGVDPNNPVEIRNAQARMLNDRMANDHIRRNFGAQYDLRDVFMDYPLWAHVVNGVTSPLTDEPWIKPRPVINTGGWFGNSTVPNLDALDKETAGNIGLTAAANSKARQLDPEILKWLDESNNVAY